MMYYRISKNEKNLFFRKKNRPGVGSDLKQVLKNAKFQLNPIGWNKQGNIIIRGLNQGWNNLGVWI